MTFEELREKAHSLPLKPGVYLMMDQSQQVIYVGKAKKLKNRVSQYFQHPSSHTPKTRLMVSKIDSFDFIVADSEFEALVLECSLIKRHMPRYNILLKDDKGYPYIRIDLKKPYPVMELSNRILDDGATYFGPYGGRYLTQHAIDTIRLTFQLPGCSKKFPQDVGKDRPCLNFHLGNCAGWCQTDRSFLDYRARMDQAILLLEGKYGEVLDQIREKMEQAADALRFEEAAQLRDRLHAIEALGQKQLVTAGTMADTDVFGYYQSQTKACFAVLHYVGGNLLDKDYEFVDRSDSESEAVSSIVKQYYLTRGAVPKRIFLPCAIEDSAPFTELIEQQFGKKIRISVPQRGENEKLVALANINAKEECERVTTKEERSKGILALLGQMLGLPNAPTRIESYDISHLAGTDIVASMVVFVDGKPSKKDYKRFKLENMDEQDDYGAMRQVLTRRFTHYKAQDPGFSQMPDLLLIDGGAAHASVAEQVLEELNLTGHIFGMVKDNRHRTRALITAGQQEIGIAAVQPIFSLIGRIQEETHRFAITYQRTLRSRRLRASELDAIAGIGDKRKQDLLKTFHSIRAIREATLDQLGAVVPKNAAQAVYDHFHKSEDAT